MALAKHIITKIFILSLIFSKFQVRNSMHYYFSNLMFDFVVCLQRSAVGTRTCIDCPQGFYPLQRDENAPVISTGQPGFGHQTQGIGEKHRTFTSYYHLQVQFESKSIHRRQTNIDRRQLTDRRPQDLDMFK